MKEYPILQPFPRDVTFDVAGLFARTVDIAKLAACAYLKFGYHLPITSVYGAPKCIWNGGRVSHAPVTEHGIAEEFALLQQQDWIPCFTFSNHDIREQDLADPVGNSLLEAAEAAFDAYYIRVSSPNLAAYLRQRTRKARICASVITIDMHGAVGNAAFYRELAQQYDRFVIHPDDNLDFELVSQLNLDKAEVLLNERCLPNCPNRMAHYQAIANIQRYGDARQSEQLAVLRTCRATPLQKQCDSPCGNLCVSLRDMDRLIELGVRHFKLQGRRDNPCLFFYDLCRYLLPDEYLSSQLYAPFLEWLVNGQK